MEGACTDEIVPCVRGGMVGYGRGAWKDRPMKVSGPDPRLSTRATLKWPPLNQFKNVFRDGEGTRNYRAGLTSQKALFIFPYKLLITDDEMQDK